MSRQHAMPSLPLAALCAASLFWVIALTLATLLAARPLSAAAAWLAAAVYFAGALVCHQLPERSFHYLGVQLPVCARCTGLYIGALLAAWVAFGPARGVAQGARSTEVARKGLMLATIPAGLTLVYEWTSGETPSNIVRATTGVVLGAAIAWLLAAFGAARASVEVN